MDRINAGKMRVVIVRSHGAEPLAAGERVINNYSVMRDGAFEAGVLIVRTPVLELADRLAMLACAAIDAGLRRWPRKDGTR